MSLQVLPTKWEPREALREKGQFWTPNWVAEAMVAYVANGNTREIFDPAVGAGAFFHAAKNIELEIGRKLKLSGNEIDPDALQQAITSGLSQSDIEDVCLQDFTLFKPKNPLPAIVANPPYLRHHRLDRETKDRLRRLSSDVLGFALDGRAGYHVYFLVHALSLLAKFGRLAFIVPADTFEGVFARKLWGWICAHFRLEAVVTFEPQASPFPGVDTNAVVLLIKKAPPQKTLLWARVQAGSTPDLKHWVLSNFNMPHAPSFTCENRALAEALQTGLSRTPQEEKYRGPVLADYAKVMRGIATGDNEFFFLTRKKAEELNIPERYLLPAIGRTRDVETEVINQSTLHYLDGKGRPTLLLSIDGKDQNTLPDELQSYLAYGRRLGLPGKALIKTRKPWYKMETRKPPPILFSYLGRSNVRFIRNYACVMPLTGFLCVYPHQSGEESIEKLWQVLRHPQSVENLSKVGKSYGSGAIKVEPRALEKLPLSSQIVEQVGLGPVSLFG
jgi:hypothetical protein